MKEGENMNQKDVICYDSNSSNSHKVRVVKTNNPNKNLLITGHLRDLVKSIGRRICCTPINSSNY